MRYRQYGVEPADFKRKQISINSMGNCIPAHSDRYRAALYPTVRSEGVAVVPEVVNDQLQTFHSFCLHVCFQKTV
jgi:hypothetical protein